tara:strand:- start:106 stop:450 length:345 start_codon:yes stop_codon:yes gene_type:complete
MQLFVARGFVSPAPALLAMSWALSLLVTCVATPPTPSTRGHCDGQSHGSSSGWYYWETWPSNDPWRLSNDLGWRFEKPDSFEVFFTKLMTAGQSYHVGIFFHTDWAFVFRIKQA